MALTNPNKLIDVAELDYFKRKADTVYATKVELQQTLSDAIEAAADANEAAGSANGAAQEAHEAAEAAAAAVVVAELPAVATESSVRAIVSGYTSSAS